MMFTSVSHKEDSHRSNKGKSKKKLKNDAPTREDIQKKFDEQSFKHQLGEQWAEVKRKTLFVPSEIVVVITSGEEPYVVTTEEIVKVNMFQRIFLLFDQPEHCFLGEIISFVTMVVIVISCVGYIASTGAKITPDTCDEPACENDPVLCPSSIICPPEENPVFELIETACITFFTVDYFTRLFLVTTMPSRLAGIVPKYFDHLNSNGIMPTPEYSVPVTIWRYMTIPMNIIDLVAILPFYVAYFSTSGNSVSIIRILRLVRVLRVFKIGGMGNGMTLMSNAMMNSLSAMGILLFFTVLGVILFGSIIFFLESGTFVVNEEFPEGAFLRWNVLGEDREESPFSSILVSCYWAMVTFTTVGFGDLVPTSPLGRFVALVLMYTGILVLALPISVIGANFQREYERLEGDKEEEESNNTSELTLWDVADAQGDGDVSPTEKVTTTPKRGLVKSASYNRSSSMKSKKPLDRERRNSNTSMSSLPGEEILDEAMIPVLEQLRKLTVTCEQMTNRIELLQKQQNEMMNRISPNDGGIGTKSGSNSNQANGVHVDGGGDIELSNVRVDEGRDVFDVDEEEEGDVDGVINSSSSAAKLVLGSTNSSSSSC